jgi:hypothetical protein
MRFKQVTAANRQELQQQQSKQSVLLRPTENPPCRYSRNVGCCSMYALARQRKAVSSESTCTDNTRCAQAHDVLAGNNVVPRFRLPLRRCQLQHKQAWLDHQHNTDTHTQTHTHTHTDLDNLAGKKHAQSCGPAADQLVNVVPVPVIAVDLNKTKKEQNSVKRSTMNTPSLSLSSLARCQSNVHTHAHQRTLACSLTHAYSCLLVVANVGN